MKASTREWIKKAESDWLLAVSLMRRRKPPVRDASFVLNRDRRYVFDVSSGYTGNIVVT